MPRQSKKDCTSATQRNTLDHDMLEANSLLRDETPIIPRGGAVGRKRPHGEGDASEESGDFGMEMQKMLECFGADISKTLIAKRKRLEQFTQNSLKNSTKRLEDIWYGQQQERNKLNDEYQKQATSVFQQWESDLEKTKDQEEKLTALFRQQQKLFQQARAVQSQRLRTLRQLYDQFSKGMGDLEKCHKDQHSNIQSELRKEMALLQKKILMDTQQQEMANVRKSLQTMLF
ncbi:synaptonemal complex protein 3-like [Liolophura sinensis]|uniref:synaptonemal complex protein 3-like n=1 Tax=Liolophura sinensis TaxID=3198878 RepID=UPI003158909B